MELFGPQAGQGWQLVARSDALDAGHRSPPAVATTGVWIFSRSIRMLIYAISAYAAAMILANLAVAQWGPVVMPFIAFALIGLDLALRDWLHFRMKAWQMGALIAATGLLTFVLNPAAQQIAVASSVSFLAASLIDWSVFAKLPGSWFKRSNGSNIAGAAVDSLLFPTL